MEVTVRRYRASDLDVGRELWRELTQRHREIYEDDTIGGSDPGLLFDDYLKREKLAGPWVAEHDGVVVGLYGLLIREGEAEIEPIVVRASHRSRGIGRQLLEHAAAEARRREIHYLSVRPVARNAEAIACFHHAGFRTLGHIEMFQELTASERTSWRRGMLLHEREFRY